MGVSDGAAAADGRSGLLRSIAGELLSPQEDGARLGAAAGALHSLCSSVTGIDARPARPDDSAGTRLPSGKAVSPEDAAACLLDHARTSKFLRGIHAAVLEARRRFPAAPVEILYAGCGPFAPLALPLAATLDPAEIRFTLLDAHERSLEAARRLFQTFGLAASVREYVRCDAAAYRHDARRPPHVVVTETMQAALEREPQAAITLNLAPQLSPGGLFIPQSVAVDACLCDPSREFPSGPRDVQPSASQGVAPPTSSASSGDGRGRIRLGRVLELTAEGCRESSPTDGARGALALTRPVTLDIPKKIGGGLRLMLLTAVKVFGRVALREGESGLTCPRVLFDLGEVRGGARVEFAYRLDGEPGFDYRLL